MTSDYTEDSLVEQPAVQLFAALEPLNPALPADVIDSAITELARDRSAMSLAAANREVWELIRDEVKISVPDRERGGRGLRKKLAP